ncbi:MAG: hypothetical protein HRU17_08735 [Polyangiaceae bacterium]|nr:hypothetical protein [Polyangiaceae bacterium]
MSTQAHVLTDMTDSQTAIAEVVDKLHTRNGWTALSEGGRLAHETFTQAGVSDAADSACSAGLK